MAHTRPLRSYVLIPLMFALLAAGCGGAPAAVQAPVASEAAVFQEIVADLAAPEMQGRGAGYAGLDLARDYVVEAFEAAGLAPGFIGPAGERQYTQPLEVDLGAEATEQRLVLERRAGEPVRFEPGGDFNALGLSGEGAFAGEAAFVGYGIIAPEHGYDSYAGLGRDALQGKVAIAFRYEPMDADGRSLWAQGDGRGRWTEAASLVNKAEWAAEHGAEALLVVNPPAVDSGGSLRSTAATTAADDAPIPVMHIRGETFRQILRAAGRSATSAARVHEDRANKRPQPVDELAGVRLHGFVDIERPKATVHNVAGVVPGSGELADEVVVVGAHYDHLGFGEVGSMAEDDQPQLHPGADDNASGVAGLILLAERMQDFAAAHPDTPRRTVLFLAFSAEERGLLGSAHLVRQPEELAVDLNEVTAMVNLDMIGRLRDELWVFGSETGSAWKSLIEEAKDELPADVEVNLTGTGVGMSDHTSFYTRQVPVLHLFTGMHDEYHRPTDVAELVNAEGGVVVVAFVAEILEDLATMPEPMRFIASDSATAHGDAAMFDDHGARLGVMPDYRTMEGGDGAAITGVAPGSAAAEAGLAAGDVIVAWDGEPVANVRQLTRVIRESRPGQEVRVTVRRDEQTLEKQVTLGSR